jgi:hypothetical protein
MANYFHSALKGSQIHEAKVKVLPAGSNFPVPEWEGQMLVVGLNLYISIKQNNTLLWLRPKASNLPQLPPNVITFEQEVTPPTPRPLFKSGVIYTNLTSNDVYYLSQGQWIKLGPQAIANKLLIVKSNDNQFQLPTDGTINAALLQAWEAGKKYYFKFEAPAATALSTEAETNYFVEVKDFSDALLGFNVAHGALLTLNTETLQLTNNNLYKIMVYFKNTSSQRIYCNFYFDLESRLIEVKSIAEIYNF